MAERQLITHGIPPTFDERSRVLVLGTMPSPASRELGFNYGHPRNRFWHVMAQLAGEPLPSTNERKRDFCLRHHIALWDVLAECEIEGASDASIRNAKPNDLTKITKSAPIEAVFCTGAKAYELYTKLCESDVGIPAIKLPSTSPANAACSLPKLRQAYAQILEHEHPFDPPELDVPDVVALEQTIASAGTSLAELMDRAGIGVAWRIEAILEDRALGANITGMGKEAAPDSPAAPSPSPERLLVTILCGNGNNGGDGWVAAAQLAQAGHAVCVVSQRHPNQLKTQPAHGAAVEALDTLLAMGATLVGPEDDLPFALEGHTLSAPLVLVNASPDLCAQVISRAHVVVDAILGTGSEGGPRAPFDAWVEACNASADHHVSLAVDVPSGISASSGKTYEPHFKADETVTMIVRKPGLSNPACGDVRVMPLAYLEPHLP